MDLGGCSNMAEVFITTDDLEGLFSEEDAWMCHSTNLHNPAPHYHPEHLASVDVEAPTGSHEHDNPLFAFLGADDDDEVLDVTDQAPPQIYDPPAPPQPIAQVTTGGKGVYIAQEAAPAAPDVPSSSDQPSSTALEPEDSKPIVPKTKGLRTSSATFSVSPSLGSIETDAMKVFLRFYDLYDLKIRERILKKHRQAGSASRKDPIIAISIKEVKRDRKIKRILLSSNAETCMTDLCTELMLKPARGPNSYHIGTNGFWIMRKSRLQIG